MIYFKYSWTKCKSACISNSIVRWITLFAMMGEGVSGLTSVILLCDSYMVHHYHNRLLYLPLYVKLKKSEKIFVIRIPSHDKNLLLPVLLFRKFAKLIFTSQYNSTQFKSNYKWTEEILSTTCTCISSLLFAIFLFVFYLRAKQAS